MKICHKNGILQTVKIKYPRNKYLLFEVRKEKQHTKERLVTDTKLPVLLKFGKELTRADHRRHWDRPGPSISGTDS